jgi:hypothetical protein
MNGARLNRQLDRNIVTMIYRYIHRDRISNLNKQFICVMHIECDDSTYIICGCGYFCINDRGEHITSRHDNPNIIRHFSFRKQDAYNRPKCLDITLPKNY